MAPRDPNRRRNGSADDPAPHDRRPRGRLRPRWTSISRPTRSSVVTTPTTKPHPPPQRALDAAPAVPDRACRRRPVLMRWWPFRGRPAPRPHLGARQACDLGHQRPAVVDDGGRAVPAHPERPRRAGHGPAIGAHKTADLEPGPLGQRLTRPDDRVLLGPGVAFAVRVGAAPDPLGPHQHHGPAEHRQVADAHPTAAVPDRPGAACPASDRVGGGLDLEPPLVHDLGLREHAHPVDAEQHRHNVTTVEHLEGLAFGSATPTSRRMIQSDPDDLVTELLGVRLWHGAHPLAAAPLGTPDQMSPRGAAVLTIAEARCWVAAARGRIVQTTSD
jgi:hypothetical protein